MSIFDLTVLKALSSHTRIRILAKLKSGHMTLSDLSSHFGMHPSSIKGHLDLLAGTGLIQLEAGERKWKYYSLTSHGASILAGGEIRVSLPAVSGLASLIFAVRGWQPVGPEFVSSSVSKAGQSEAASSVVSSAAQSDVVSSVPASSAISSAVLFAAIGLLLLLLSAYFWRKGRKNLLKNVA